MALKGIFYSGSGTVGDRQGDFASALIRSEPTGMAPLLAMTSGMDQKPAQDTVVTWFEENSISGRGMIVNNAGTGTTIIVEDASFIVAQQVYMVETSGEYVLVLGVADKTLTVMRGFASTAISAVNGSVTPVGLQLIMSAHSEASDRPDSVANNGFPRFNYTQIFRDSWDVSGTARAVKFHTGDRVAKNRRDCALFHSQSIERALMWGKMAVGTQSGQPFRTMDGILAQIKTNRESQPGGGMTYVAFRDFFEACFSRNIKGTPNERVSFCANPTLSVIDDLVRAETQFNVSETQKMYGMSVTELRTPFGDVKLVTHPIMNESFAWRNDLYLLHPGAVKVRWLRRTHEDTYDGDGKRAGRDADFGVLTSELSVEYNCESTGGILTGINAANVG